MPRFAGTRFTCLENYLKTRITDACANLVGRHITHSTYNLVHHGTDCFNLTSRPSSTTVGSLLRPVGFCRLICPSLTPLGCQTRQVLQAISMDSDADVARLRGRLLRDLRAQEFPPRNSRLLPRFNVTALCLWTLPLTSTLPWAVTPHTFYLDLMKVASVLCGRWWPIATESEFPGTECHGSLYFSPAA